MVEQEDLGANEEGEGAGLVPQTGYLELKDFAGHAEMAVVSAEEVRRKSKTSNFALVNYMLDSPTYFGTVLLNPGNEDIQQPVLLTHNTICSRFEHSQIVPFVCIIS